MAGKKRKYRFTGLHMAIAGTAVIAASLFFHYYHNVLVERFPDIYFHQGGLSLQKEYDFASIASKMGPATSYLVTGFYCHTDSGAGSELLDIAKARADVVKRALVEEGIEERKLQIRVSGHSECMARIQAIK